MVRTAAHYDAESHQSRVVSSLAGWIVDRMEATWRLWLPALPDLVGFTRETERLLRLEEILNDVLDQDDLDIRARVSIVLTMEELSERLSRRRRRAKSWRKKKPKRRAASKQKAKAEPTEPDKEDEEVQMAFDFTWE